MKYIGDLNPGEELEIDMKAGTVKINGKNVLDNVEGAYFKLSPGSNSVVYSDESTSRNLSVKIVNNNKHV